MKLTLLYLISYSMLFGIDEDEIAREFSKAFSYDNLEIVLIEVVDNRELFGSKEENKFSVKAFERYLYAGHPVVFSKLLDSVEEREAKYFAYPASTPSRGEDIIPAIGKWHFSPVVQETVCKFSRA